VKEKEQKGKQSSGGTERGVCDLPAEKEKALQLKKKKERRAREVGMGKG